MPVGLDSAPPDYFAQSKCSPPPPHSHLSCFSLPYKSERIYVLEYMRTGKPGKRRRAEEQADMSLFGQECNDKRGERGVLDEGGDICLHFPEPLSPSSFSFSSHGRQQPEIFLGGE